MNAPRACQDCLRTVAEARILWTAPGGDIVCAECYRVRAGEWPRGLREIKVATRKPAPAERDR